jgi:queuine tRNA-ribosyltransferase
VTFAFEVTVPPAGPSQARTGRLTTQHGSIDTPVFMPVGTLANVKALLPHEVRQAGASIVLVNAYHLYLRPGHELVARLGGVHRFMDWHGPILSDSGGFQVFSLAAIRRIGDEGVRFRSHIDGSEHLYTPELAMQIQRALGVDIAMPLDDVRGPGESREVLDDAAERTLRWFDRCREAAADLTTFAIVQGGGDESLRRRHARELAARTPPGFSIGGLSVGESKPEMWAMTRAVVAELPPERPRYLMGVGSPEDLVEGVRQGIDMFDCVLPTRLGRNGALFTHAGRVNILNARFRGMDAPVVPGCDCYACTHHGAAYLHHLFRNREILAYRLATIHNIRFLTRLFEEMRAAIRAGAFDAMADEFLARYRPADPQVRSEQHALWRRGARHGVRSPLIRNDDPRRAAPPRPRSRERGKGGEGPAEN